jgi:soluble lytic murein transglycosylase
VLAGHGESELAWEALRAADGAAVDLAVAVLTRMGRAAEAESILARRSPAAERDAFGYVQRARLRLEAGQPGRALEILASIEETSDPGYAAYRDLILAQARLARGDAAGAADALQRALRAGVPAAARPAIDETRVDVLQALGRREEALAVARQAAAAAIDAEARSRMLLRGYHIAAELDDRTEALHDARRLFDEHRSSEDARACADDFVAGPLAAHAPPEVLLSCASVFQAQRAARELRRALRVLDGRTLSRGEAESQRLLWGEYHFLNGDYARAIALARPAYADESLRRRSMLLLARSLRRVGRGADAAAVYEAFATTFPEDGLAAEALFTAAALLEDAGQGRGADELRDRVRRSYPSTFHGWAAAMELAGAFERRGQRAEAAAIYEQRLERSQRTDEAALFYLARVRAGAGAAAEPGMLLSELEAVNPYSFYVRPDVPAWASAPAGDTARRHAALSDWLLGTEARRERAYLRVLASAKAPSTRDGSSAAERARRFLEAGFDDWAERELEAVVREGPVGAGGALQLARLFDENGMPWRSVQLYERARAALPWDTRRTHTDDFRYLTYPIPYPAQVLEASSSSDLAPHLLYGLMREESRFEVDVVSRAGAVGLMQLMPETAGRVAAQMDIAWEGRDALGSPEVNVPIGAWYAADLLRAGRGSVAWMLAAYNAGPGAAGRWIEPGTVGEAAIDAVDAIDYRETRGYVKRVVESANVYHDLYFGGGGRGAGSPR